MLFWVGESVTDVAIYVADGRDMALPLLAEGLIHDWNWILSELSLRNQARPIGVAVFGIGVALMAASVVWLGADLARHLRGSDGPPVPATSGCPTSTGWRWRAACELPRAGRRAAHRAAPATARPRTCARRSTRASTPITKPVNIIAPALLARGDT